MAVAGFVGGKSGDRTDHYVRALQKQYRLDADGIVGPRTWGVRAATYSGRPPASGPPAPAATARGTCSARGRVRRAA
ncbi:peptidoglycan-binding protein [Streptomyces antibioticus]|uniref:peptidoglycan-binding domain-containing protein n=1 Tax=Streptomyces antibioticus TaxID=1890 RepID=UPI003691CF09